MGEGPYVRHGNDSRYDFMSTPFLASLGRNFQCSDAHLRQFSRNRPDPNRALRPAFVRFTAAFEASSYQKRTD